MRVFGLPMQFVIVVAVSLTLTIFLGAWVADERVKARSGSLTLSSIQSLYVDSFGRQPFQAQGALHSQGLPALDEIHGDDGRLWEKAFLFACPLH